MKKFLSLIFVVSLVINSSYSQNLTISTTITSPVSGCYLSANETITVLLVNAGPGMHFGNVDMTYELNGGPPVTYVAPIATLGNSAVYIYTFPVTDDFSACQAHNLRVYCNAPGDPDNTNDTIDFVIESDCAPVLGTLSGPPGDVVCIGMNAGNIDLTGYTGNIQEWGESTDNGATWSYTASTADTLPYLNVATETQYEVVIGSLFGYCPSDTNGIYTLMIDQLSNAGTLPADFDICDNGNGGFIESVGYLGNPVDWLVSGDNGASWIPQGVANDSISYLNLIDTTQYQFIVQNGVCPADTSAVLTLTLIPGSFGGTIVGESVVCNQMNDSSLYVTGFNGTVLTWWYSLDSGMTWLPTLGGVDSTYAFSNLSAGTIFFSAEVQLGTCPSAWSTPHILDVLPLNLNAGPDTTITDGDVIQLYATGGSSYLWFPDENIDDVTLQNPTVSPTTNTTYTVQITDINGCVDSTTAIITVLPDLTDLIVPNLFTPNGDGFNDMWIVQNLDAYTANEVTVFNIYGQVVYESAPYLNDWDGSYAGGNILPDGTYFYIIRLNDPLFPDPIQGALTLTGNE